MSEGTGARQTSLGTLVQVQREKIDSLQNDVLIYESAMREAEQVYRSERQQLVDQLVAVTAERDALLETYEPETLAARREAEQQASTDPEATPDSPPPSGDLELVDSPKGRKPGAAAKRTRRTA